MLTRFFPKTFTIQFILFLVFLILLNFVLLGLYMGHAVVNIRQQDVRKRVEAIASDIAVGVSPLILNGENNRMEQMILNAARFPGIRGIIVVNASQEIIGQVERRHLHSPKVIYHYRQVRIPKQAHRQIEWMNHGTLLKTNPGLFQKLFANALRIWMPIDHGQVGWICVDVSVKRIQNELFSLIRSSFLLLFGLLSLSGLSVYFFLRPSLKGLSLATAFASQLGDEYQEPLPSFRFNNEIKALFLTLNQTKNRLIEQESILQASKIEISAIVENLSEGILTLDRHGMISAANRALGALLGEDVPNLMGQCITQLIPAFKDWGDRQNQFAFPDEQFLRHETKQVFSGNVMVRHRDGHLIPALLTVNGYSIDDHNYYVGTLIDQREHLSFIHQVEEARDAALKANNAKLEFLAAVSHEIRTPLNGVIGMLELLMQSSLRSNQLSMAEIIDDSAKSLQAIINEILDFSKIESGKLELAPESLCLEDLLQSICFLMEPMATRNKVMFSFFIDPNLPKEVLTDPLRLRQIVTNLLNNAIKFSSGLDRPGDVYFDCRLLGYDGEQVMVRLRVIDNGIGISHEGREKLFKPFEQASAYISGSYGGTGLGLAITRNLVEMFGGHIEYDSEVNKGTTFICDLPLKALRANVGSKRRLKGLRGAIIGHNRRLRSNLKQYLEYDGASVVCFETASAMRAASFDGQFVLILSDQVAYESQGEVTTELGRFSTHPKEYHKILLTRGRPALSWMDTERFHLQDLNYLSRNKLVELIVRLVHGEKESVEEEHTSTRRLKRPAALSRDEAMRKNRLILIAEDNTVNQKVVLNQLRLLGEIGDIVDNGKDAFDRWKTGYYRIVLTDIHMPLMDGYELARRIRGEEAAKRLKRTPILALSAAAFSEEKKRCEESGMDGFLLKPVALNDLKIALDQHLSDHSDEAVFFNTSRMHDKTAEHLDLDQLRQLVGDDPVTLVSLLENFRDGLKDQLSGITTTVEQQDWQSLRFLAHKLKSSSKSVGAGYLSGICLQMEEAVDHEREDEIADLMKNFEREVQEVDQALIKSIETLNGLDS